MQIALNAKPWRGAALKPAYDLSFARNSILPALVFLGCFGIAIPARAQLLERYFPANVPAYQDWFAAAAPLAEDGGYSPLGVRTGGFILHGDVNESLAYDSNIFGTSGGGGSGEFSSNAALSANSNWAVNGINAALSVDNVQYLQYADRSYTAWTATLGGTIEAEDNAILLGYSHFNTVSLPTDVGIFGLSVPVIDQVDDIRVSDTIGRGSIILVPALIGQTYQFTPVSSGLSTATLGLFNRQSLEGSVTAGYEFAGGHNAIFVLSDTQVGYSSSPASFRPSDYNDISALTGIEYRQSAILAYRALIGYEERFATSRGTTNGTISAPAGELDLIWTPTVLTTITGRVSQSLQNEPTGIAQGLTDTSAQLSVTYAFRRNVALDASLTYDSTGFPKGGATQSDIAVAAGCSWSLSRNVSIDAHYTFTRADGSGSSGLSFTRHQISVDAQFGF